MALAALVAAGCDGGPQTPPPETPSGTRPLVVGEAPLEPGRYATRSFVVPFSFEVGDRPWVALHEEPRMVTLVAPGSELVFASPIGVYELRPGRLLPRQAPLPNDLVAWLERRPDLVVGEAATARLGELEGTAIDVEVTELYEEAELLGCPLPCVPIGRTRADEPLFLTHTHRVLVTDSAPSLVVVYATGNPAAERQAEDLLESMRFISP
jgi:hypothetical protein